MDNFVFSNPTRIIFGRGVDERVGTEVKAYAERALLVYGGGSAERSGLLGRIRASLEASGVEIDELGGVRPNPRVSLARDGIALCRERNIPFVLAVGGGSVIDTAKVIAAGVYHDGDPWGFFERSSMPDRALSVGAVLTIPSAGSESNPRALMTNEAVGRKRILSSEVLRPSFALINPEISFSLSPWQTACGAVDIFAHVIECYFTNTRGVGLADRLCEATLRSVVAALPLSLSRPLDYASRAEMLWAVTIAHNDLLGAGREGDWASHAIEREINARFDSPHGAGLSAVIPSWMRYVYRHDVARFAQFASRVWDVECDFDNLEASALEGIRRTETFFRESGLPVRLSELAIPPESIDEMAEGSCASGNGAIGHFVRLGVKDVREILLLAR